MAPEDLEVVPVAVSEADTEVALEVDTEAELEEDMDLEVRKNRIRCPQAT